MCGIVGFVGSSQVAQAYYRDSKSLNTVDMILRVCIRVYRIHAIFIVTTANHNHIKKHAGVFLIVHGKP